MSMKMLKGSASAMVSRKTRIWFLLNPKRNSHPLKFAIAVFPNGCTSYDGLNNVECYKAIWLESGCLQQGSGWPGNLNVQEAAPWSEFNIE